MASDESASGSSGNISYAAFSWIGSLRQTNQDSFGLAISSDGLLVAGVADGMGGHAGGDVASSTAISMLIEAVDNLPPQDRLDNSALLIADISGRLRAIQEDSPQYTGMGTTLSSVVIDKSLMTTTHIGDSRIYSLRRGQLIQLTKDHSWVQDQVDAGLLNADDAFAHPRRNILTRTLDARASHKPDADVFKLEVADRIFICSDGVHGVISDKTISAGISHDNLERGLELIRNEVRKQGANDNATGVLISVDSL